MAVHDELRDPGLLGDVVHRGGGVALPANAAAAARRIWARRSSRAQELTGRAPFRTSRIKGTGGRPRGPGRTGRAVYTHGYTARQRADARGSPMTDQLTFTETELLASHDFAEPLDRQRRALPRRVRRGRHLRVAPHAATAGRPSRPGRQQRVEQFATPILDIPLETWPEHFPNVEQSKFLIRNGVTEPIISTLTRIGTVEGFGGMLRLLPIVPDLAATLRRGHRRHRDRPPRPRPVRGPRPRRGRLRGRGRPQPHVVRRPRHRLREPGHRGPDRA